MSDDIFIRKDTPTIMDGKVVRWQLSPKMAPYDGEISASRNGVLISGTWPVFGELVKDRIKSVLDEAYNLFVTLHRMDRGPFARTPLAEDEP